MSFYRTGSRPLAVSTLPPASREQGATIVRVRGAVLPLPENVRQTWKADQISHSLRFLALRRNVPHGTGGFHLALGRRRGWSARYPVVLPFTKMSDDPPQEYFANRISEDIRPQQIEPGTFLYVRPPALTYADILESVLESRSRMIPPNLPSGASPSSCVRSGEAD
jgi:hypothetical protein